LRASEAVAIVGAGATGLACAAALAREVTAVVLDRVPVPGGVLGHEHPAARRLASAARAAGAALRLGVTATTWDGEWLVGMGQDGAERIRAGVLVVAGGTRPRSRAELGLVGARPAGVVAATVACHLAETGLLVGRRPLVLGGGDWAARSVERLLEAGAERVFLVCPDGALRDDLRHPGVELVEGVRPVAVEGSPRVEALRCEGGESIPCDALVLAHGLVPLRNVDGAVWEERRRTVFAQPADDPGSVAGAERTGRAAARAALRLLAVAA
jgi:thioredoxin reductase